MNTDIVWGGLLVLSTVCATIQHYITKKSAESEIASLKMRLEFAKQETRIWKTTAYRHADERNHAVRMAQYWRKQALNEHFGFEPEKAAPSPTVAEVVNEMMRYDALIQATGWAPADNPSDGASEGETVTTTKVSDEAETATQSAAVGAEEGDHLTRCRISSRVWRGMECPDWIHCSSITSVLTIPPIPAPLPARRLSVLWPARWNQDASSTIC